MVALYYILITNTLVCHPEERGNSHMSYIKCGSSHEATSRLTYLNSVLKKNVTLGKVYTELVEACLPVGRGDISKHMGTVHKLQNAKHK